MIVRLVLACLIALGAASARAQDGAVAEPVQFYIFSFTDTPAVEAAQDVVTGALGRELEIDLAAEGVVSFRADGEYTPDALLRDFGDALLDQDLALVRTGTDAYALVPRANLALSIQRGGVLMATPVPDRPAPRANATSAAPPAIVYGRARWWEGAVGALLLFLAGGVAGAASLWGGQVVHRRAEAERLRLASPVLRLTDQRVRPAEVERAVDPELVIPRFEADRRD